MTYNPSLQLKHLYQPINQLGSLNIPGFEALIRWNHPRFGMVGPNNFIHFAEQAGVIHKITREQLIISDCDSMQGYLVSKPVEAEEALRMVKRKSLKIISSNTQN